MTPEKMETASERAKKRLKQYLPLKQEVERQRERLGALYGPRIPNSDGMPHGSGISDPTGSTATLLIERKKRAEIRERKLAEFEAALEKDMEVLTPEERDLIRYRYMDGLSWEEVCIAINYSRTNTHRLHSSALVKLGEEMAKAQG